MLRAPVAVAAAGGLGAALFLAYRYLKNRKSGGVSSFDDFFEGMGDAELTRVAFTSRWVASERAIESARSDALYSDPFATVLGGEAGLGMSNKMKAMFPWWPEYHVTWMAVRTAYIDERIASFFAANPGAQYVSLGSGLDARAYRLDALSSARCAFELDVADVVAAFGCTMQRLEAQAKCPRSSSGVDLAVDNAMRRVLLAAGFSPSVPTFWLMEGLTMYLMPEVNASLLQQIDALSTRKSTVCAGFIGDTSALPKNVRPPFAPSIEEYTALLRAHGWSGALQADRYGDKALDFGRYPHGERGPDASQCFVLATR